MVQSSNKTFRGSGPDTGDGERGASVKVSIVAAELAEEIEEVE